MIDLTPISACGDVLPVNFADTRLAEATSLHVTSLAPRNGQQAALSNAVQNEFGFGLPDRGAVTTGRGAQLFSIGHAHYLLVSDQPAENLAQSAHITDQSSAWVMIDIVGADATEILARLAPVDLGSAAFPVNSCVQTELARIHAILIRTSSTEFRIMAPRSMVMSLAGELTRAARAVQSRRTETNQVGRRP